MMHNFPLEYSELWLASSSLNTRQSKLLIDLLARYTQASSVNPDATFPETDDVKVGAVLYPICMRIQACTVKHAKRSKTNKDNADARWSKAKGKGEGMAEGAAPAPKAKAPITLKKFMGLAGETDEPARVKKLYHELEAADWVYHGYRLRDDNQCKHCLECYEEKLTRCGLVALIYYNGITRNEKALEIFNAMCDVGAELGWDFCDVTVMMQNVRMRDGWIVYKENGVETECETVENFIDALRKLD